MESNEGCPLNTNQPDPNTHMCSNSTCNRCLRCLPLIEEDMKFDPRSLFVAGQSVLVKPMANESPNQFYLLPQQLLKVWDAVKIRHSYEVFGYYDPEYIDDDKLLEIGEVYGFYKRFGDCAYHRSRYLKRLEYNVYNLACVDTGATLHWKKDNELSEIFDDSVYSAPAEAFLCSLMVKDHNLWDCIHKIEDMFGCRANGAIAKAYVVGTVDDCVNVRLETPEGEDITTLLVKQDSATRSQGLVAGDPPKTEDYNELVNKAVSLHGDARALFQDGAVVDVRVVHVESARRFWVVPVAREEKRKQFIKECPFGELTDWYKLSTFNTPPSDPIEKGKMYWTPNNGGHLVRGIIVGVDDVRRCLGRTFETGDVIETDPDDNCEYVNLTEEFIKMPPLVVECCLDIQPKNGSQEWSKEAVLHFHKSFADGQFPYYDGKKIYEAVPTGQVKNGRIEVVLKDGEKNFAKELLQLGFGGYMPQED